MATGRPMRWAVISAVFLPMAFFGGSTGVIYRQFSITMVSAMTLSVLVALIFSPALCATLLKPPEKGLRKQRGLFGWFNRNFERGSEKYAAVDQRQARWINELSAGLKITDLAAAARALRELADRLETNERPGPRGKDRNATP